MSQISGQITVIPATTDNNNFYLSAQPVGNLGRRTNSEFALTNLIFNPSTNTLTATPGPLTLFNTTNGITVGSTLGTVTLNGTTVVSNINRVALEISSPNYITVASTGTYILSATNSDNILLVTNTGLTATLTFPSIGLVEGQRLRFSLLTNTVTLALTTGPTLSGTFSGSVSAPTTIVYVYRSSNTTWYRLQ